MPPAERARRRENNRRGERAQLDVVAGRERTRVEDTEREEYPTPHGVPWTPLLRVPGDTSPRYPERINVGEDKSPHMSESWWLFVRWEMIRCLLGFLNKVPPFRVLRGSLRDCESKGYHMGGGVLTAAPRPAGRTNGRSSGEGAG